MLHHFAKFLLSEPLTLIGASPVHDPRGSTGHLVALAHTPPCCFAECWPRPHEVVVLEP